MTARLDRYEFPTHFLERFRPVKADAKAKGLAAYVFDTCGLRFYRQMTTGDTMPAGAVWSVISSQDGAGLQLAHGLAYAALGYVVAQVVPGEQDPQCYPLPVRLGYRAKISTQAMKRLLDELATAERLTVPPEIMAFIEQRIEQCQYPAA